MPEPIAPASYQSPQTPGSDGLVMPAGYWRQSDKSDVLQVLHSAKRVVITEFVIELVDLQSQGPFQRQMAVNPPPMIFGPLMSLDGLTFVAGVCVNIVGLGRKNVTMSENQQHMLADSLLAYYEEDLRHRNKEIVPRQVLQGNPGYLSFNTRPVVKSTWLKLLNPIGSDTGVVLRSRMIGPPGLGVITCSAVEQVQAEAKILEGTGADIAISMRLRVGSFHKKAAFEEGSVIRLTTADGATIFTAQHSILSDGDVISTPHFKVFTGHVEPVLPADFYRELSAMLPKFLDLALREPIVQGGTDATLTRLPPVVPEMPIVSEGPEANSYIPANNNPYLPSGNVRQASHSESLGAPPANGQNPPR